MHKLIIIGCTKVDRIMNSVVDNSHQQQRYCTASRHMVAMWNCI